MSYATLSALITSTTQNTDTAFAANIDQFIQAAERMIYMEANLPSTRKNATGVTVTGNRSVTIPTDCIALKSVEITTATGVSNLIPKAAEFITEMYPVVATQAEPKYYAHYDATTILIGPTPGSVYTVGFHYFAVPTSVISGATWLDTNFPHVLLYGALLQAYVFMKGDADIMAYYLQAYTAGLEELKSAVAGMKLQGFRS